MPLSTLDALGAKTRFLLRHESSISNVALAKGEKLFSCIQSATNAAINLRRAPIDYSFAFFISNIRLNLVEHVLVQTIHLLRA